MRHETCLGELKPTPKRKPRVGHYKCEKCGEVVKLGTSSRTGHPGYIQAQRLNGLGPRNV